MGGSPATFGRVLTNSSHECWRTLPTCDQMFDPEVEPMTLVVGGRRLDEGATKASLSTFIRHRSECRILETRGRKGARNVQWDLGVMHPPANCRILRFNILGLKLWKRFQEKITKVSLLLGGESLRPLGSAPEIYCSREIKTNISMLILKQMTQW